MDTTGGWGDRELAAGTGRFGACAGWGMADWASAATPARIGGEQGVAQISTGVDTVERVHLGLHRWAAATKSRKALQARLALVSGGARRHGF